MLFGAVTLVIWNCKPVASEGQSNTLSNFWLVQGVTLVHTNETKIDQQAATQLHDASGWEPAVIASLQASKFAMNADYSNLTAPAAMHCKCDHQCMYLPNTSKPQAVTDEARARCVPGSLRMLREH